MSQDQSFLLGWHFILFSSEFSHQLLAHGLKYRLEESASKNQCCVIMCQGITKSWNQGNLLKDIDKKTIRNEEIEPIKRVFT
jgi:hypothetical protein